MKSTIGVLILCFGIGFCKGLTSDILDGVQDMINNRSVNTADDRGRTALHLAAEKGDGRMVDLLIQVGADVNIVDNGGVSALHYAALNNNETVTDLLIRHKADVNLMDMEGCTPLFLAALNSNERVIESLMNNGANVSVLNRELETPLLWAAINMNEKIADLLIKRGVNISLANDLKQTALHNAAYNSNEKVAALLVASGADVNAVDEDGSEALFYTVLNGDNSIKGPFIEKAKEKLYSNRKFIDQLLKHWTVPIQQRAGVKIAELLIKNGGNINRRARNGMTAYDIAVILGNDEMNALLAKHNAEMSSHYTLHQ